MCEFVSFLFYVSQAGYVSEQPLFRIRPEVGERELAQTELIHSLALL